MSNETGSRVLIIGAGDIARRAIPALRPHCRVYALARSRESAETLAAQRVVPLPGDLDDPDSLAPLVGVADAVIHLAPPPGGGTRDMRTRNLIAALERAAMLAQGRDVIAGPRRLRRLVYLSTSGVYGDCGGAEVDESRPPHPQTERARRRLDAESALLAWGERSGTVVSILRVPGIYAAGRLPLERLRAGVPVLRFEEDVYTGHIHADDLAAVLVLALQRGEPGRCYNVNDDTVMKMGDYFDLVADVHGIPRPPRIGRSQAAARIAPELLSFMGESRRLINRRMKTELGVTLLYPTVHQGLGHKPADRS